MKPIRIVLITGNGPEHRYVANKLSAAVPLTAIIVDHGKPAPGVEKIRRYFRRYTIAQLFSRVCLAVLRRMWRVKELRRQTLASVLGPSCLEFARTDLLHHAHGINIPESVA